MIQISMNVLFVIILKNNLGLKMEIKSKMEQALNKQLNRELYSGYLYLSMSAYFESINLPGFAHWMKKQASEEEAHAMKLYKFIVDRGGRVKLSYIETPKLEWKSPLQAFEDAYKHELKVTDMIHSLVGLARSEKDYATETFLQWFVNEQVEEEESANDIVQKLKMIGDSKNTLFMLDSVLSKRE